MKKAIVYQTLNLVNNKIYIGVHLTENPEIFDGYLGCGFYINHKYYLEHPQVPIHFAIKKYGIKNFKRTTLAVFDTYEEALNLERELVNIDFIKRSDTYNVSLGGLGGQCLFPINLFDRNGKLIYTWDNIKCASEALGISHTSINSAKLLKGSCLGYFWSSDPAINVNEYSYHTGTKTYLYDYNGDYVTSYESVTEAAHAVDSQEKAIYRAIKSEIRHKDCYWSFSLFEKFVPKKLPKLVGKTLYLYDLEGNFIRELQTGKETYEYFGITSYGCLKQALLQNRPYKGVQISLEKVEKMNPATVYGKNTAKKVGCYSLDGNLLETFDSIKAAIAKYGCVVNHILRGQQRQTHNKTFKLI